MDYCISLNNANKQYDNPINTFKAMLYLCSLLTDNGLNEKTYIITCDELMSNDETIDYNSILQRYEP